MGGAVGVEAQGRRQVGGPRAEGLGKAVVGFLEVVAQGLGP